MRLSACMIVKNEEKMLERTLPSLSKYADEIILVDTGSSDHTLEVAKKYGAKLHRFTWINDFSAARNESLKYASGDWILWIDADEFLKEDDLKSLKKILVDSKDNAYSLSLYESGLGKCEKKNGYYRAKVFRSGVGFHFVKPINEQLVDNKGKVVAGREIPVSIYHWGGHLGEERMKAKRERYVKLYSRALQKNPEDAYLHFLLANKLNELKRPQEALEHYSRAHEIAPDNEIGRQALEKKASLLLRMKRLPEAAQAAQELLFTDPSNIPARNIHASIYLVSGKIDKAIEILSEALQIKIKGKVENVYQSRVMPNFLLGKAYELKGEKEKATACFAEARKYSPGISGAN